MIKPGGRIWFGSLQTFPFPTQCCLFCWVIKANKMEMCSIEASSVTLRSGNSEFPAVFLLLPSTSAIHSECPWARWIHSSPSQAAALWCPGKHSLRISLPTFPGVFCSENWAWRAHELLITQPHKNTARPSLQEHCRTPEPESELFFPCAGGEGPRGDDLMEKRAPGKAPGLSCPGSQHTQGAVPSALRHFCTSGGF